MKLVAKDLKFYFVFRIKKRGLSQLDLDTRRKKSVIDNRLNPTNVIESCWCEPRLNIILPINNKSIK